jgi:hypothetical protein
MVVRRQHVVFARRQHVVLVRRRHVIPVSIAERCSVVDIVSRTGFVGEPCKRRWGVKRRWGLLALNCAPQDETRVAVIPTNTQVVIGNNLFIGLPTCKVRGLQASPKEARLTHGYETERGTPCALRLGFSFHSRMIDTCFNAACRQCRSCGCPRSGCACRASHRSSPASSFCPQCAARERFLRQTVLDIPVDQVLNGRGRSALALVARRVDPRSICLRSSLASSWAATTDQRGNGPTMVNRGCTPSA